jgi:outer membrane beta-barrel protein
MKQTTARPGERRAWGARGASLLILAAVLSWSATAMAADSVEPPARADSSAAPESPLPGDDAPAAPAEPAASGDAPAPPAVQAAPTAPARAPLPNGAIPTIRKVRLDQSADNVVRTGPGNGFAIVGVFPKGTVFPVIAKSGDWYNVQVSDSETGWIHSSLCKEFDDMSDLEFKPNPKLYSRTGTYMLTGYGGAYAFDRKSNSFVAGGRVGYYVFDRLQVEGGLSWTHVHRPAEIVESLFGLSLEAEDFHMLFYHLILTYELLPGRQMVPYVTGGVGSTIMQGETEASFNYGAGTMLYLSRKNAVRWEVRDYRFRSGQGEARVTNNNVEFMMGTTFLF